MRGERRCVFRVGESHRTRSVLSCLTCAPRRQAFYPIGKRVVLVALLMCVALTLRGVEFDSATLVRKYGNTSIAMGRVRSVSGLEK